ncbi:MAG: hypothetical protein M3Z26_12560 [Bacteroidota bacterium]|nr:hypothetical protein [Bacteroidota bacterium]
MKEYIFKTKQWIQVSLFNFCVVALAGVTLRYKINFPLPLVNQKYLLEGHSNFAFTGWVSLVLMVLMVNYLQQINVITNYKKYHWILVAHCVVAYGILISFIIEGYAFFSILCTTLSIFISYFFIYFLWLDLRKVNDDSYASKWFKAALMLWAFSSLGAFMLAYLMASHNTTQDYYFGALYFFLHFQYNGWFLFVCFGLLFSYLYSKGFLPGVATGKKLFIIMAITVVPSYFLSVLWLKLPWILRATADVAGILQLLVMFYFVRLFLFFKKNISLRFTKTTKYLWIMASIAFIIKIILQMLSIVPWLSHLAFGFRPIVIGYLHLSFLGIITFFILGYINQALNETFSSVSKPGVLIFAAGVLIQEIILMSQGLEAINVEPLPYANIILFYTAILIAIGLIWIIVRMSSVKSLDLSKT